LSSLAYILIACFLISLLALTGFLTVLLAGKRLENLLAWLVSFAAGTLIGGALFHLLPESIEEGGPTFVMATVGIMTFFAIESFLYAFLLHAGRPHAADQGHAHAGGEHHHIQPVGILNLIGDGVHNMIDGVIIASAFLVAPELGVITAIAVAMHELPQEISDFGVLLYSGYKPVKALFLNYLAALSIFIGAIGFYLFAETFSGLVEFAIPFAAGAFLYIANADLLAGIKGERMPLARRVLLFVTVLLGIALLWYLRVLVGE
jgi:zinc and cadmium transporter